MLQLLLAAAWSAESKAGGVDMLRYSGGIRYVGLCQSAWPQSESFCCGTVVSDLLAGPLRIVKFSSELPLPDAGSGCRAGLMSSTRVMEEACIRQGRAQGNYRSCHT